MTEAHLHCLRDAFMMLLGEPSIGAVAYARCLPPEVISRLCASSDFEVPGWLVYGVAGTDDGKRYVTADRAVDLREEKKGSVLLLVDPKEAGPGMDGIYSAARELSEASILDCATHIGRQRLDRTVREFADRAMVQARKLGRVHAISPYRTFDFYARCVDAPRAVGQLIPLLGLWPIDTEDALRPEDLVISAQLVERLLLGNGAANTVRARVEALLLSENARDIELQLEEVLRAAEGNRWTETVIALRDHPGLWLNRLQPGFVRQELLGLEIVSWRVGGSPEGKLLAWSGLAAGDDGHPVFLLGPESSEKGKADKKLDVRWRTRPVDLQAGAVAYEVSVVTGSGDVLASRSVTHIGKETQRCIFTREDFEDLDEDGKWTAKIQVHPVGEPEPEPGDSAERPLWKETEEFILTFGALDLPSRSTVGRKTRALVEEAIRLPEDQFAAADQARREEDRQGFINWRLKDRSARVSRPGLVKEVEEGWRQNNFAVGRWVVRIRADGSRASQPQFQAISPGDIDPNLWRRVEEASRQMGQRALDRCGFIGMIYQSDDTADRYVNAWATALEAGPSLLALAHTVEVQDLMGETLGLIVLPSHPLRVAWHQAYDELISHVCYREGLKHTEAVKTLATLDGSFMPTFLPGLPYLPSGTRFVFGDTLGFYSVAMLRTDEPEPQAAIAQMARCLSSLREEVAPSVGGTTAAAIGREIDKYADLHPAYTVFRLNVLRPGDGFTVAHALSVAQSGGTDEEEPLDGQGQERCFQLDLFPGGKTSDTRMLGRYLSETAEKRRAGIGSLPERDRWMLRSRRVGEVALPLLRWSKRAQPEPDLPAHLAVAFDTFSYDMQSQPEETRVKGRPLEVYGLVPSLEREFCLDPVPTWTTTVAAQVEGDRHPGSRALSDRLLRVHSALLKAAATDLDDRGNWPILTTQITAERADSLQRLHELSDWVITVDRNAGIEYFDAPRQAPDIYDTYVIDCVPERQDLDCVQLVTSTSNIGEVLQLLDQALADMSLSCSPRNCEFLLDHLKAISGRLVMRLANYGLQRGELIALALFHANCVEHGSESAWVSMRDGFLVPLDDVRDLLIGSAVRAAGPSALRNETDVPRDAPDLRSDLVYVNSSRRGVLQFTFIEVKYRRLLRSALQSELLAHIQEQTATTRDRWFTSYFSPDLTRTQLAIRRKRLAHALRFYADKARRHDLEDEAYQRLCAAIDKLFRADYEFTSDMVRDRGYVFCPDHPGAPAEAADDGQTRVMLFGPQRMPDVQGVMAVSPGPAGRSSAAPATVPRTGSSESGHSAPVPCEETEAPLVGEGVSGRESALLLGHTLESETPVTWSVSVRGNPHLMIVGLPGMGKTTCIVNLCAQLAEHGITPLIFSYHEDLEAKLSEQLGSLICADVESGLGFNPMRIAGGGLHAWIDNVGMLRDIFASIYPDLGDLQTNEIREAIKKSYHDQGFGGDHCSHAELSPPEFQRFFEILKRKPKPNVGLMARLDELNDYGFFRNTGGWASLLESRQPTIIRLHATQNEVLQNAMASFILLNLYQNMFLRGPQPELTHAIIFDEAHRASRLKLLPTMAKECRKFGLSLIVASQEAKDFSPSLYAAVANYLVLRVTEADANALAKNAAQSSEAHRLAGRLKQLDKYTAMFVSEGRRAAYLRLHE